MKMNDAWVSAGGLVRSLAKIKEHDSVRFRLMSPNNSFQPFDIDPEMHMLMND
jgi:hypothetical protein